MSKRIKISDFAQDDRNFNRHTEAGMKLLQKSIEQVGVIESITVSSDDKIISGNARQEKISAVLGDAEPIVIETDGTRPIVLKRTDIQSGTKQFHEAALLANTTAKQNIDLDADLIQEVLVEEYGIDVEELGIEAYNILEDDALFGSGTKNEISFSGIEIIIDNFKCKIEDKDDLYPLVQKLKEYLEQPCEKQEFRQKIRKLCESVF